MSNLITQSNSPQTIANPGRVLLRWTGKNPDESTRNSTAARVAQRFLKTAEKITTIDPVIEVLYSNGGIISSADGRRLLRPHLGELKNFTFRKSIAGHKNKVSWEALDEEGNLITGKLVLHAAVAESKVVSWAEIEIDDSSNIHTAKEEIKRDEQLESIGRMGRDLIRKLREKPRVATPEVVAAIVAIVDVAEASIGD
jgi:hypothetical protein